MISLSRFSVVHFHVWYRPFDADLYEDEGDEDEILDEEGRARLKLKVWCAFLTIITRVLFGRGGGEP